MAEPQVLCMRAELPKGTARTVYFYPAELPDASKKTSRVRSSVMEWKWCLASAAT